MIVFMPLVVFLPKLIWCGMQRDAQAVIEAFGKNEQVMRVCWMVSIAIAYYRVHFGEILGVHEKQGFNDGLYPIYEGAG